MATVTGITAAKADEVLGMSVVSGTINGAGHLILTRANGSTIDAGDFTAIVTSILNSTVSAAVATAVPNAVAGTLQARGNFSGAYDLVAQGWNNVNIINALITMTMVGNVSLNVANMVANPKANTMFAIEFKQDATGSRILTLTGFKKSQGVLTLSTAPNAVDIVVFMYDGSQWLAGFMGVDFK